MSHTSLEEGSRTLTSQTSTSKRQRRAHRKSHTGCTTCKIRKKKCDETKPACLRCTSTGRRCDGYALSGSYDTSAHKKVQPPGDISWCYESLPYAQIGSKQPHQRSLIPRITTIPTSHSKLTDLERHCFDYFRLSTGPAFAAYLGSSIWRGFAIRTGIMHPAVLSCIIAVGAVHRRYEYGISREAFEYCAHASRLYEKALSALMQVRQKIDDGISTVEDRDAVMTGEVLLGIFQSFQNEDKKAVEHVHYGIRQLLNRPLKLICSESYNYDLGPTPNILLQILQLLNKYQVGLFNRPVQILAKYGRSEGLKPIPKIFTSLEEGRDFIFTELGWISRAVFEPRSRDHTQKFHVDRLLQWSVSHAETVKGMIRTPEHNRACKLMKLAKCVAYAILYVGISTPGNCLPDIDTRHADMSSVIEELWKIIELREEVIADLTSLRIVLETYMNPASAFHYTEYDLCFDTAAGPPKNQELKPQSSGKIRNMVRYTNEDPTDDCWPNLGVYAIAERFSGLEEHAVISAMSGIIPGTADPVWTDITWIMDDRKLLLRYSRPDTERHGLLWTQEWWSF